MSQDQSPDQLEQLLPWHVNGTLSPEQQARVEQLLAQRPAARRDLAFLREVAAAIRLEHRHYEERSTLADLLARVQPGAEEPDKKPSRTASRSWLDRVFAVFEPKFAFAVLTIAVQGILIGALMNRSEAPRFSETRSFAQAAESAQIVYRVSFAPAASERDIRLLLVAAHARIVYGPTQLADYYLTAGRSAGDADEALLRQSPLVDSIDKVDRIPTEAD